MTKQIRCRRCSKVVEVPDDYDYKTCRRCRAKDKKDRRVKAEERKSSKKLVKSLKTDKLRMPEALWSYKNYCNMIGGYFHTKPTFEQYEEEVKNWKINQILLETDAEVARQKRQRELENDPWERENFLGPSRDKAGEWLRKRERNMTEVNPELVQEAMEGPVHPASDEELSESDKRIQKFFKEQLAQDEESEQDTEQEQEDYEED